jgi:hypothetical protein
MLRPDGYPRRSREHRVGEGGNEVCRSEGSLAGAESVVLKRGLPVVNDCIQGLKIALSNLFGSCSKERHRT